MGWHRKYRMTGKRLRSGRIAVPVVSAVLLPGGGRYAVRWALRLACGCSLPEHRTWMGGENVPRWAGCPSGCAEALRAAAARRADAGGAWGAAVAEVESEWAQVLAASADEEGAT